MTPRQQLHRLCDTIGIQQCLTILTPLQPAFQLETPAEDTPTAEDIYAAYPRKVGRPKALQAITKALRTTSPHELLRLTTEYATARTGAEPRFTPHPSTWYNSERYKDDQETWADRSGSGTNGHRSLGTLNQGRTYGGGSQSNAPRHVQGL